MRNSDSGRCPWGGAGCCIMFIMSGRREKDRTAAGTQKTTHEAGRGSTLIVGRLPVELIYVYGRRQGPYTESTGLSGCEAQSSNINKPTGARLFKGHHDQLREASCVVSGVWRSSLRSIKQFVAFQTCARHGESLLTLKLSCTLN